MTKEKIKFVNIGNCLISVVGENSELEDDGSAITVKVVNRDSDKLAMMKSLWEEVISHRYYTGYLIPQSEKYIEQGINGKKLTAYLKDLSVKVAKHLVKEVSENQETLAEFYRESVISATEIGKTRRDNPVLKYIFSIDGVNRWIDKITENES